MRFAFGKERHKAEPRSVCGVGFLRMRESDFLESCFLRVAVGVDVSKTCAEPWFSECEP